jgi:hypothetical protein
MSLAKSDFSSGKKIMPRPRNIKKVGSKYIRRSITGRTPGAKSDIRDIPVEFVVDIPLRLQIKIKPQESGNSLTAIAERPLIPALFQIAACANDSKSLSALKDALALDQTPLAEMMLDPANLQAILKAVAPNEKLPVRHDPAGPFGKKIV